MAVYTEFTRQSYVPEADITCYYWVLGDERKPPFVVFYGYTGWYADFKIIASQLVNDYFILIPEFPGWRESQRFKKRLTVHNYAHYFKQLFDHLGIRRLILFGHCVGAAVAIEFATLYPGFVVKIFLVSTPYLGEGWIKKSYALLAYCTLHAPPWLRPLFFFWRARAWAIPYTYISLRIPYAARMKRMKFYWFDQPQQGEAAVEEFWVSYIQFDFDKVRSIKQPVHLIHGQDDWFVPLQNVKQLKSRFAGATFDVIKKAGHLPLIETPGELVRLIKSYL